MKRTIFIVLTMCVVAGHIRAQSIGPATINATGNKTIIGTNEFEWSVGEMAMISTLSLPNIIITQGVLQPGNDNSLSTTDAGLDSKNKLHVFPNPATSQVNIQLESEGNGTLSYRLLDMAGRTVCARSAPISKTTHLEQMDISRLAAANYLLEVTVTTDKNESKHIAYKIQKL